MSGFNLRRLPNSSLWAISVNYYSPKLNAAARSVPGMRWESELKAHVGYIDAVEQICARLKEMGLNAPEPPTNARKWPHNLPVSYDSARDYQREGIDFLINQSGSGALLADDMGVGKSFQTVKAVRALRRRTVIVCEAHVRGVWEREPELDDKGGEIAKWWPKAHVFKPYGITPEPIPEGIDVTVIHYDIIYAWVDALLEWAADDMTIVFDEAQMLLSATSRRSEACRTLAHVARGRIALTGTPPVDKVKDLHNVIDTISPGRFGEFFGFGRQYCCPPEAPILMGDMTFKALGDVRVGDTVVGWTWGTRGAPGKPHRGGGRKGAGGGAVGRGGTRKKLTRATVLEIGRRSAPIVKLTMASGRTIRCTPDHRWLSAHNSTVNPWARPLVGHYLSHVADPSPVLDGKLRDDALWLGGIYDGEGNPSGGRPTITQNPKVNPGVSRKICETLTALGLSFSIDRESKGREGRKIGGDCDRYRVTGSRQGAINFINWCHPVKHKGLVDGLLSTRFREPDRILKIEDDGIGEVVSLTTSTGNYVVWGYASKNCDAQQKEVAGPEKTKKLVWDFSGRSNVKELRQRLDWFCLRRTKREVLKEIPALQRQIVDVQVPPKYRTVMNARLVEDKKKMRAALDSAADGKFKQVIELVRSHLEAGQRVVVGTHRRAVCEKLADAFSEVAPTKFIHGGVPLTRRNKIIAELRRVEGPVCLVTTIDSTATGIDLTFANVGVFAELVWEPRDLAQWEARTHRFGASTTEPVLIQYVIARGTGDELILHAVINKLDNFLDLVETDKGDGFKEALKGEDDGLSRLAAALKKMGKNGRVK